MIDGKLFKGKSIFFGVDNLIEDLKDFVVIGPGVGSELGGDENVVDVDFKRGDSGKHDLFVGVLADIDVGLEFHFRGLVEFIGHRVLDDDGARDVTLDFLFYFI